MSLHEAINFSNDDTSGDAAITFDPTVFATTQTITLSLGQLELSNTAEAESITAPAAGVIVTDGGTSRVFQVDDMVTASLTGLTITGGIVGNGGGLANFGSTTLSDSTVTGNSGSLGGGLFNYSSGTVTLVNSVVSGNTANSKGGGVYNDGGSAALISSTVSGNYAGTVRAQRIPSPIRRPDSTIVSPP